MVQQSYAIFYAAKLHENGQRKTHPTIPIADVLLHA
jgi:hypothetical protein